MNKHNYLTISPKECLIEYKAVMKNSERKLNSAKILAKEGDYGSSISLLIISKEELIKAIILFLDGTGFKFRQVKGVKSLFNNHRLRYLLAMIFSILSSFGDDFKKFINTAKLDPKSIRSILTNEKDTYESLQNYLLEKADQIEKEIEFFSTMDKTRQIGLYSDQPNNKELTEQNYFEFYRKVTSLHSFATSLYLLYQSPETKESLNSLQESFMKNDWYGKIANLVSIVNTPKMDSFPVLLKNIESFRNTILEMEPFEALEK